VFSSARTASEITYVPGPSDYSPYYGFSSIKYTFPKYNNQKGPQITPGPADYNTIIKAHAPKVTIGKAKRLLLDIGNLETDVKSRNLSRKSSNCFQTQMSSFASGPKEGLRRESFTKKHGRENCGRSGSVKKNKKNCNF
jgi:hypothetical protein